MDAGGAATGRAYHEFCGGDIVDGDASGGKPCLHILLALVFGGCRIFTLYTDGVYYPDGAGFGGVGVNGGDYLRGWIVV